MKNVIKQIDKEIKETRKWIGAYKKEFKVTSVDAVIDEVLNIDSSVEFDVGFLEGLKTAKRFINSSN